MATAVEAKAVTEFSFWIEIPFYISGKSFDEISIIFGATSSSSAPSMKFVIAEAQWAETLGTGSDKVLIKAGKTMFPYSA